MSLSLGKQRTIARTVHGTGIGLHTGQTVNLTLKPAEDFTGIVFHRTDVTPGAGVINVCAGAVDKEESWLCTRLKNEYGVEVHTVEHLMAALFILKIDNIIIEMDGSEVPIFDGSAQPFLDLLDKAGVVEQEEPRKGIKVLEEVIVKDGNRAVSVKPAGAFSLWVFVDYGAQVPPQSAEYDADEGGFRRQLAKARTFCFEKDIEFMRSHDLIKGGSMENALVIGKDGPLNEGGYRYKDEVLRHKAMDCLGDFYMAGYPILGAFHVTRPGHELNNKLLQALLSDKTKWKWV